jgi:hypothetical protein
MIFNDSFMVETWWGPKVGRKREGCILWTQPSSGKPSGKNVASVNFRGFHRPDLNENS